MAVQAVIGALRANMSLDTGRFDRGIDRTKKKTDGIRLAFDSFRTAGKRLGNALTQIGFQYIGFLTIKDAFNRLMRQGSGEIDAMAKAARRLDGSIGGIRALELAASEAGVSASNLADEFSKMERALVSGSAESQKAMRRLGLSIQDLDGKDIDARIALIADRIHGLGLSSAETSHMLRQLGIMNQDMALLMRQGGDAIREARKDIIDYRAELSQVDVAAVEKGRDQISRLGYVIKSVTQEVVGQTVPRFGQLAQVITDSMREGGNLRMVMDQLLRSLDRLAVIVAVTATLFTVKYVGAMVIARIATLNFAAAVATLGRALRLIGISALVIGLSELVLQFIRLREAVGDTAEVISLLQKVWAEVVERMKMGLQLFILDWQRFDAKIQGIWFGLLAELSDAWTRFLIRIGPSINRLAATLGSDFRVDLIGAAQTATALRQLAREAERTEERSRAAFIELAQVMLSPLTSIKEIREALKSFEKELPENEAAVFRLSEGFEGLGAATEPVVDRLQMLQDRFEALRRSLDPIYDEAMRYAEAQNVLEEAFRANIISLEVYDELLEKLGESFKEAEEEAAEFGKGLMSLEQIGASLKSSMADTFASIVSGSQNANDAVRNLLQSIAKMIAQRAFMQALGGLPIPGFARGTDFAPGGLAMVGEEGPELVNLPRGSKVVSAQKSKQIMAELMQAFSRFKDDNNMLAEFAGNLIPGFARGTNFAPGGMAMVGEMGPELVNFPGSSMNSTASLEGGQTVIKVELSQDLEGRILEKANGHAVEIVQKESPGIIRKSVAAVGSMNKETGSYLGGRR